MTILSDSRPAILRIRFPALVFFRRRRSQGIATASTGKETQPGSFLWFFLCRHKERTKTPPGRTGRGFVVAIADYYYTVSLSSRNNLAAPSGAISGRQGLSLPLGRAT